VRRATFALHRSLVSLVSAIETDSLDALTQTAKKSAAPSISSNFCEALTRFEDESLRNSLGIGITWAASLPVPAGETPVSCVRVQNDYFSRIEEVRRELRSPAKQIDDTFIGTVERLDGEMGPDGRRSGDVILSLLLPEGNQARVRTNLNADEYAKAYRAHMSDGTYVKVTGLLHPGRQPRQLSNLRSLDLIQR
jgi:hypothetical protein